MALSSLLALLTGASSVSTVTVPLPKTAPFRIAVFTIKTETFMGPLPISPIGGPDAKATIMLKLDSSPELQLFEDGYKRGWDEFRTLAKGKLDVVPAPHGQGFAWSARPDRWEHVWFDGSRVVRCQYQKSSVLPELREVALETLLRQACDPDVAELAVRWARANPDAALDEAFVAWLGRGSEPNLRAPDELLPELKPRLAKNPKAAAAALAQLEALSKSGRDTWSLKRFLELTEGLPGRPVLPTVTVVPLTFEGGPLSGVAEVWTEERGDPGPVLKRIATVQLDGGVLALSPPPAYAHHLIIRGEDAVPWVRRIHTLPAYLGEQRMSKPRNRFEMRVTRTGQPVAGAEVWVWLPSLREFDTTPYAKAVTTAGGVASFDALPSGELVVWTRAPNEPCDLLQLQGHENNPGLTPKKALELVGRERYESRVVGSDFKPVPNLRVSARGWGPLGKCLERTAVTDANGRFTLEGVRRGQQMTLTAEPAGKPKQELGSMAMPDDRPFIYR